ncbi:hypothetical protein FOIG_02818 [Fusarium odoratissimum NRRL 54006]|uniref:Uncharacterized protein n=2 Tax=Fusarium oxysporum species complex TaxID=171631 RepID=X0K2Z4_FUSO5|nr:uncharacterized protein FOIG_02818 [Fusarium odoratissimum NRRL 54006]EXM07909.1 hypothetical protein FOIG_02818 [Fusarium odoratissimum NRRL 54006]TXC10689.1 hypothetical protein FocTR4_00004909 [Fusarium oxysporum f. sp. cubense]
MDHTRRLRVYLRLHSPSQPALQRPLEPTSPASGLGASILAPAETHLASRAHTHYKERALCAQAASTALWRRKRKTHFDLHALHLRPSRSAKPHFFKTWRENGMADNDTTGCAIATLSTAVKGRSHPKCSAT